MTKQTKLNSKRPLNQLTEKLVEMVKLMQEALETLKITGERLGGDVVSEQGVK